jgi:hypothetical protein
MKKTRFIWAVCCLNACMLASTVQAQYEYMPIPTTNNLTISRSERFTPSRDLVGADVKNPSGEKLGAISEVYLNHKTGQAFAIVGLDGDKHAIIPLQALVVMPAKGAFRNAEVVLNKTVNELESLPQIVGNDWKRLDDEAFVRGVYAQYKIEGSEAMGSTELPTEKTTGAGESKKRENKFQENQRRDNR